VSVRDADRGDDSGLTLIEVVVATAVFGLVVFVLTGFYFTASSHGLLGRSVTTGTLLAQQRLEWLKGRSFAGLVAGTTTETVDELGTPDPAGRYTRTTTITRPVLGSSRLSQVAVTVTWLEGTVTRTVTLTTLMGDY